MTYPTSIAAAHWSRLAISIDDTAVATALATPTEANFKACFSTVADYAEIKNIRDMPQIGDPANIVNVPVYGQRITQTVNAQSDAPSLELTINYVADDWKPGSALGDIVGSGDTLVFQFAFLTSKAVDLATDTTTGNLGDVPNAVTYFVGKIESLLLTPSRDDAATATVTLSIQSDFYGPFTVTNA